MTLLALCHALYFSFIAVDPGVARTRMCACILWTLFVIELWIISCSIWWIIQWMTSSDKRLYLFNIARDNSKKTKLNSKKAKWTANYIFDYSRPSPIVRPANRILFLLQHRPLQSGDCAAGHWSLWWILPVIGEKSSSRRKSKIRKSAAAGISQRGKRKFDNSADAKGPNSEN